MWHGEVDHARTVVDALVAEFNGTHPDVHVTATYNGGTDVVLSKVLMAIAAHPPGPGPAARGKFARPSSNPQATALFPSLQQSISSLNAPDLAPGDPAQLSLAVLETAPGDLPSEPKPPEALSHLLQHG